MPSFPSNPTLGQVYSDGALTWTYNGYAWVINIGGSGTGGSGTPGVPGTSGTSGKAGTSGVSGTSGTSGTPGSTGPSGTSGTSGISGSSGTSGSSGLSGTSGSSGTSGESGTSGKSGTAGTSGSSISIQDVGDVTWDMTGFVNRTDSTLSFNAGLKTFTISPTTTSYDVYYRGELITITSNKTITLSSTSGGRYIILDPITLDLQDIGPIPSIRSQILVSYLYWDDVNGIAIVFGDERHAAHRDTQWHYSQHLDVGAIWRSGGALSYTLNDDTNISIALDAPISIADEDVEHSIQHSASPNGWYQQVLEGTASIPTLYLNGTSYVQLAASTVPWVPGTFRASYNPIVSGSGSLADAPNNSYVAYWLVTTNDSQYPVKLIMGRVAHNTIKDAQDEVFEGYGLPLPEFVPMYKIVLNVSNGYVNSVKAVIAQVDRISERQATVSTFSIINDGTSGTSGIGAAGTSGTSGIGEAGTSGTSGIGEAGTSGTSGIGEAGTSGTSGIGEAGTSGTSGIGEAGTSGTSGTPGTSTPLSFMGSFPG